MIRKNCKMVECDFKSFSNLVAKLTAVTTASWSWFTVIQSAIM